MKQTKLFKKACTCILKLFYYIFVDIYNKYFMMKVKIVNPKAKKPVRIRKWDAGLSLICLEKKILEPGERYRFKLWIAIEIERWYVALTQGRSWHAEKYWIETLWNVIDCNYRWEISVMLINNWNKFFKVEEWDNIAQLVIMPVWLGELKETEEISENKERGNSGFGSSDLIIDK